MQTRSATALKAMFLLCAAIDGAIAISWFLIAAGYMIPNILNGHTGAGADYRLAMYVAAMFMASWTILLAWGAARPVERRGLLPIVAAMLLLSVLIEFVFYGDILGGAVFVFGVTKRIVLSAAAIAVYLYSLKSQRAF